MTTSTIMQMNMEPARSRPGNWRYLSLGATLGPVLFAAAWVVLGVLQPTVATEYGLIGGVSGAVTNPISALGVGPDAHVFNLAFVLCGFLTAAGVLGAQQSTRSRDQMVIGRSLAVLLALSPLGLALAGVFTLANSLAMHNVAALLVFVAPVFAFFAGGAQLRRITGWRSFSNHLFLAAPLTLILLVVFVSTFKLPAIIAGNGIAGLTERFLLSEIHAWYVALGWRGFRS